MRTIAVGSSHITAEQQLGEVAVRGFLPKRVAGLLEDTRVVATITPEEARDIARQLESAATAAEAVLAKPRGE